MPPRLSQAFANALHKFTGGGAQADRTVAHAAGGAGDGFQLAQAELLHGLLQNGHVLAHGGFGGGKHFTEVGQGKDAVGGMGQNLAHDGQPFVALDLVHGVSFILSGSWGPQKESIT